MFFLNRKTKGEWFTELEKDLEEITHQDLQKREILRKKLENPSFQEKPKLKTGTKWTEERKKEHSEKKRERTETDEITWSLEGRNDPKEVWEIESGCEEEITSGNDSEGEENILYADPSDIPEELLDTRGQTIPRKKNVRFGENCKYVLETSETSSFDNEYFGYPDTGRKRSMSQDLEFNCKPKDHFRMPHKTKWRNLDCTNDKIRPKSTPEKLVCYLDGLDKKQINEYEGYRMRRREHRCGRYHYRDLDDVTNRKPKPYKFGCGDEPVPRCCDHCIEKQNYIKMKQNSVPTHKHMCHMMKDSEGDSKNYRKLRLDNHYDPQNVYHHATERYYPDEYCDHGHSTKIKKKTLESVQEQMEPLSDSTYKVPCTKYSSQTIPDLSGFQVKKSAENLSDWLYYNGKVAGDPLGPPRIHKMRSRRTRMNKIKNGWKKALVQTVRDGSRNERVGVLVMGSRGPEFYAKNSKQPGCVPFRKSKSFLDGASTSFEVMTVDCKNVFLSSSEPAPRTEHAINDLVCPEDDVKMEEKIAMFSKNVNDIVRDSEEKFYKALSTSEFPEKKSPMERIFHEAGEGIEEEEKKVNLSCTIDSTNVQEEKKEESKSKFSPFSLSPFPNSSPRVLRTLRKTEKKVNLDSKAMADALNEQAKQYKENQVNLKDKEKSFLEGLKDLQEKFPPKDISQDTMEENLALWAMSLDQLSETNERKDQKEEEGKKNENKENDERCQIESVRSNNSYLQRRKKEAESTTEMERVDEGTVTHQSRVSTPKEPPKKTDFKKTEEADLISAMFHDLMKNGCAVSQVESENLQNILKQATENPSNDITSFCSSEGIKSEKEISPRSPKTPSSIRKLKDKESENTRKTRHRDLEGLLEEVRRRKVLKMKTLDEKKSSKRKQNALEDRMNLLRQSLPSLAAENEAAHLKQLKKYIDKFIGRAEASTNSEFSRKKEPRRRGKAGSTDSSEVRVDACKILDFVSNPFKKISSEVTINIAKKLTDTLIQDKAVKCPKNISLPGKTRKQSENETDDEGFPLCGATSGSERCEEPEPTYLKQLKKMRNEHLNNILLEVKRLSELLRFLDRCNRLHF